MPLLRSNDHQALKKMDSNVGSFLLSIPNFNRFIINDLASSDMLISQDLLKILDIERLRGLNQGPLPFIIIL